MSSIPPYTGDLGTRLGAALYMDKDTDVVFNFENGTEVKAHRLILATGSPVFDAMFYGGLAEKNKNIPVPDVEVDIFRELVHYLYTDKVDPNENDAIPLLYAAKKYQVTAVEKACEKYVADNVTSSNVFAILDQAIQFSADHLRDKCLEIISRESETLISSPALESLSQQGLCSVLEQDSLAVKETELLTNVRRWARVRCEIQGLDVGAENERLVLGPALNLVRFPLMTVEEFTPIATSGLLTRDEAFDVYREIGGKKFEVSVKGKCQLVGIGLFGARGVKAENNVIVELFEYYGGSSSYGPYRSAIRSDGTDKICDVYFPEKVELTPNTTYRLKVNVSGPPTFMGAGGQNTASANGITVSYWIDALDGRYSSVYDGQIPELIFAPLEN